eukprot:scaffold1500_cov398-Prasinococcus_capsulatus_cf.AAC.7
MYLVDACSTPRTIAETYPGTASPSLLRQRQHRVPVPTVSQAGGQPSSRAEPGRTFGPSSRTSPPRPPLCSVPDLFRAGSAAL